MLPKTSVRDGPDLVIENEKGLKSIRSVEKIRFSDGVTTESLKMWSANH